MITKLRAVLNELKTAMTEDFESMLSEASGHHHFDGKDYYADTAFLNSLSGVLPGMEMKHLGFGEFSYQGDEGKVEFDRVRGKDFPGMSGRSHKLYDNKNGKLVAKLIKAMEKKNKSELVEGARVEIVDGMKVRAKGVFAKGLNDGKVYTLHKADPFNGVETYNFELRGRVVARFDVSQIQRFLRSGESGDRNGLEIRVDYGPAEPRLPAE